MTTEGDAQGQRAGCESRGVAPVAGADVAHGPRRHAGRDRDLAHPGASDAGRDDPPERVDAVEAAVEDALRQRAACPPASPTALPRNPDLGAPWSLVAIWTIASPLNGCGLAAVHV